MSNQWSIGDGVLHHAEGVDQYYIEKGRKKTITLFLSLISFTLILTLSRDVIFSHLDTYNVINSFFRILFEFILFIFLYRGKPWARIILILFYAFRIVFHGMTLYYASDNPWHDIIIKSLMMVIFCYAIYFLTRDKNFLCFFRSQRQSDLLIRQSTEYQYQD